MNRSTCALVLAFSLFLGACAGPGSGCSACDEGAYERESIWDGVSFDGWSQCGPGAFEIADGQMTATGGMGMLWYSREKFRDFRLTLQWKVTAADDNSGVFVRFPDPGDDPWVAVNGGYEIQICDTEPDMHNTGSIYSFQGPTAIPTKPVGEWNTYEITVVGQHYGELVNEFEGERSREGYIGVQNHDDGSPVSFRGFSVKKL